MKYHPTLVILTLFFPRSGWLSLYVNMLNRKREKSQIQLDDISLYT